MLRQNGFSFVEIFVGMMILATGATSLMMVSEAIRKHNHAKQRYYARQSAQVALHTVASRHQMGKAISSEGPSEILKSGSPDSAFALFADSTFPLDKARGLKQSLNGFELQTEIEGDSATGKGGTQRTVVSVFFRSSTDKLGKQKQSWHGYSADYRLPLK